MNYEKLIEDSIFIGTMRTPYDEDRMKELGKLLNQMEGFSVDISKDQEYRLSLLADAIININTKNLIIEWAHIYVDSFDKENFLKEILLFKSILENMKEKGIKSRGWLLVDDYTYNFNGQEQKINFEEIKNFMDLNHIDFVEELHMEGGKEILEIAKGMVKILADKSLLEYKNNNIYLKRKNILLYDRWLWKYSCALLDAAFTLIKYSKADTIINILPYVADNGILDEGFNSYLGQQYKVRTILREYSDKNPEIFPRFFNIFFEKSFFEDGKVDMQVGLPNFARKNMKDKELIWKSRHMDNVEDYVII